ncbi:MAG TPA: type I-U CRISPR-associated protein Csx17, partial [Blastocatellia bacterium]|nr:type I-U CRISPR-associated protein Csx17 [Blastocatellia bacterium]
MNRIELKGCAPEPLMHYLKALGVMRLVAEQLDANVRGAWQADTFILESQYDEDALTDFFLNHYIPTPIVAPWNNGSGFHSDSSGSGKKVVHFRNIRYSQNSRLLQYRETIEKADILLKKCLTPKILALDSKKRSEALKPILLPLCRNRLPDETVQWLDAAAL